MERYRQGVDRFIVMERNHKRGEPREWVVMRLVGKLHTGRMSCAADGFFTRHQAEKQAQSFRAFRDKN